MTFSNWVSKWINQIAHVGWGAYLVMALSQHITVGHAALVVFTFATVKEGIFDPFIESGTLQGSGLKDWTFWMFGIILGIVSFIIW